jgi:acetyl-CoA C-acetyltransferase
MADAYVYGHVRTPRGRGRPDGALHAITPVQLAASLAREPTIDPRTTG